MRTCVKPKPPKSTPEAVMRVDPVVARIEVVVLMMVGLKVSARMINSVLKPQLVLAFCHLCA
jgi:hypothetical protein